MALIEAVVQYPRVGDGPGEPWVTAMLERAVTAGRIVSGALVGVWFQEWFLQVCVFTFRTEVDITGLTTTQVTHTLNALASVMVADSDAEVLGIKVVES